MEPKFLLPFVAFRVRLCSPSFLQLGSSYCCLSPQLLRTGHQVNGHQQVYPHYISKLQARVQRRTPYYTSTQLKVINQASDLLNKIYSAPYLYHKISFKCIQLYSNECRQIIRTKKLNCVPMLSLVMG